MPEQPKKEEHIEQAPQEVEGSEDQDGQAEEQRHEQPNENVQDDETPQQEQEEPQEPESAVEEAVKAADRDNKGKSGGRFVELKHRLRNTHIRLSLYALLPNKYTDYIEKQARYARLTGYRNVTASMLIIFWILAIISVAALQLTLPLTLLSLGVAFVSAFILPYALFVILAEKRKTEIEQVLPDALLLMSANIESGLTVEKAFLLAARDEFGPLADDIRRTAMKMFGGTPVEDALTELAESTNSALFAETLKLLIDGINSGGEASQLLESSAEDIRNSLHLREEIAANVKMYSIFILFASMLGAPLLFAVSTYLTETTADLWGGTSGALSDLPSTGVLEFHQPEFHVEFFRLFAVMSLIISNMFAALIISEIKYGNIKHGLKYVPVFTIIAVIVYFVVDVVIQSAFGGAI